MKTKQYEAISKIVQQRWEAQTNFDTQLDEIRWIGEQIEGGQILIIGDTFTYLPILLAHQGRKTMFFTSAEGIKQINKFLNYEEPVVSGLINCIEDNTEIQEIAQNSFDALIISSDFQTTPNFKQSIGHLLSKLSTNGVLLFHYSSIDENLVVNAFLSTLTLIESEKPFSEYSLFALQEFEHFSCFLIRKESEHSGTPPTLLFEQFNKLKMKSLVTKINELKLEAAHRDNSIVSLLETINDYQSQEIDQQRISEILTKTEAENQLIKKELVQTRKELEEKQEKIQRFIELTSSTAFALSRDLSKAVNPLRVKSLLVPVILVRYFIRWLNKRKKTLK